MLTDKYMEEEVVCALKNMRPAKAPGIDGFLALFFSSFGISWEER